MIGSLLDAITKPDIDALVTNAVREGRTIDYKLTLPGSSDKDKKEFLADVSSFANASGGQLVFGVSEEGGIPVEAKGLDCDDSDREIQRLDSMMQTGIEPRIPSSQIIPVNGFSEGPILVIRIPRSWASPHMVTFKNASRFYTRNNAGKYQMDIQEIRSAFIESESLGDRIRRFRDDRLGKVVAGDTPSILKYDAAKVIIHVIPVSAFGIRSQQHNVAMLSAQAKNLLPIAVRHCEWHYNIDGFVEEIPEYGYCQAFRNGIVEAVDAAVLREGAILATPFENEVIHAIDRYLKALRELDVPPPLIVLIALVGVKDFHLDAGRGFFDPDGERPIDRDMLILPDGIVESYDCDIEALVKPAFDALWNATGHERSFNYDEAGNRRRGAET